LKSVQDKENADGAYGGDAVDPLEPLLGLGLTQNRRRIGRTTSRKPTWHRQVSPEIQVSKLATYSGVVNSRIPQSSFGVQSSVDSFGAEIKKAVSIRPKSVPMTTTRSAPALPSKEANSRKEENPKNEASDKKSQPQVLRDSQHGFASKSNTVLVLDWDDTIFPTTFVRKDCGLNWRYTVDAQVEPGPGRDDLMKRFEVLADKVEAFIRLACSLTHVVIVTLAHRPWIESSSGNFMPRLQKLLTDNAIKVVYAREVIPDAAQHAYFANAFKTGDEESEHWTKVKATAMEQEFESFHSARNLSWKNLITVGDSVYEHAALVHTADAYVTKFAKGSFVKATTGSTSELITQTGHLMRVRTKTVKLLDDPSIEEMCAQISLLTLWLPHIVQSSGSLEVELEDSTDDIHLRDVHQCITGERSEELRWYEFVGLEIDDPPQSQTAPMS
jgi:hypothetical protein